MIENDLLKNTSDDIAQFLYKGEGLNKTAIGDYLGERSGWMRFLPLTFSVGSCGIHIHVDDTGITLAEHIFHSWLQDTPVLPRAR